MTAATALPLYVADDFSVISPHPHFRETSIQRESLMVSSCCETVSMPTTVLLTSQADDDQCGRWQWGGKEEAEDNDQLVNETGELMCVSNRPSADTTCSQRPDEILWMEWLRHSWRRASTVTNQATHGLHAFLLPLAEANTTHLLRRCNFIIFVSALFDWTITWLVHGGVLILFVFSLPCHLAIIWRRTNDGELTRFDCGNNNVCCYISYMLLFV